MLSKQSCIKPGACTLLLTCGLHIAYAAIYGSLLDYVQAKRTNQVSQRVQYQSMVAFLSILIIIQFITNVSVLVLWDNSVLVLWDNSSGKKIVFFFLFIVQLVMNFAIATISGINWAKPTELLYTSYSDIQNSISDPLYKSYLKDTLTLYRLKKAECIIIFLINVPFIVYYLYLSREQTNDQSSQIQPNNELPPPTATQLRRF